MVDTIRRTVRCVFLCERCVHHPWSVTHSDVPPIPSFVSSLTVCSHRSWRRLDSESFFTQDGVSWRTLPSSGLTHQHQSQLGMVHLLLFNNRKHNLISLSSTVQIDLFGDTICEAGLKMKMNTHLPLVYMYSPMTNIKTATGRKAIQMEIQLFFYQKTGNDM